MPSAAAVGVDGFIVVEGNGEFVMSCTAPTFIGCSAAGAASVSKCFDIPFIGNKCVQACGGVVAGLSSLAFSGGHGGGDVVCQNNINFLGKCSWTGTSGGCAKTYLGAGTGCKDVKADAGSDLNFPRVGGVGGQPILFGPEALAVGNSCGILLTTSTQGLAPAEVENLVEEAIGSELRLKVASHLDRVQAELPAELQPAWAAQQAAGMAALDSWVQGIEVTDDLEIVLPEPMEFTIEVSGEPGMDLVDMAPEPLALDAVPTVFVPSMPTIGVGTVSAFLGNPLLDA